MELDMRQMQYFLFRFKDFAKFIKNWYYFIIYYVSYIYIRGIKREKGLTAFFKLLRYLENWYTYIASCLYTIYFPLTL